MGESSKEFILGEVIKRKELLIWSNDPERRGKGLKRKY